MTLAGSFLAGAKGRLLPVWVPFRFFTAAVIFHLLMWLALLAGADDVPSFRGGPGPTLAAIHLLTLGVLTTTAIGASVQLLPVATRRALVAVWPIKLVFWLTVPGTAILVVGFYALHVPLMLLAAVATSAGLILYALVLADNLRRATSLPVVAAYGWAALAALVLLIGLGLLLVFNYEFGALPDHGATALAHMILGGFGFMGMLALGFSHVLIPMFALSSAPEKRLSFIGFALAVIAILLGVLGAFSDNAPILTGAALIGLGAAGVHLWLMGRSLASGMRKRLGLSFVLIRASWLLLPMTLLVGIAALHGWAEANGPALFGFLLLVGWLLTFLLGVLQRILPFLASMHATRPASGAPPLLSEFSDPRALTLHAICHGLAVALIAFAIAIDATMLVRTGAILGLIGAAAFAWFVAGVVRRLAVAR
jgi:hypothetical protein